MNENLIKAVIKVMQTVKGIDKTMTIGTGQNSYKGVPDKEVKKIIGGAMADNGLCLLPIGITPTIKIDRWESTYNGQVQQKQSVFTEVVTEYMLCHESGESIVVKGYGHGIDTQDKGAGKATTYALKYAMLYIFSVPTGKIDDADEVHSEQIETPKKEVKAEAPKNEVKTPERKPEKVYKPITDAEMDEIIEKIKNGEKFKDGSDITLDNCKKYRIINDKQAERIELSLSINNFNNTNV